MKGKKEKIVLVCPSCGFESVFAPKPDLAECASCHATLPVSNKLTTTQREILARLSQEGFIECASSFGGSQRNGPLWRLHEKGLAVFGWGPKQSFLKVQGFFPTLNQPATSKETTTP